MLKKAAAQAAEDRNRMSQPSSVDYDNTSPGATAVLGQILGAAATVAGVAVPQAFQNNYDYDYERQPLPPAVPPVIRPWHCDEDDYIIINRGPTEGAL